MIPGRYLTPWRENKALLLNAILCIMLQKWGMQFDESILNSCEGHETHLTFVVMRSIHVAQLRRLRRFQRAAMGK